MSSDCLSQGIINTLCWESHPLKKFNPLDGLEVTGFRQLLWRDKTGVKRATCPKAQMSFDFLKFLQELKSHASAALGTAWWLRDGHGARSVSTGALTTGGESLSGVACDHQEDCSETYPSACPSGKPRSMQTTFSWRSDTNDSSQGLWQAPLLITGNSKYQGLPWWFKRVKNPPAMQETWIWTPESRRSPGEGHDYPLQYSCLENPMSRGTWWAAVHGVSREIQHQVTQIPEGPRGGRDHP